MSWGPVGCHIYDGEHDISVDVILMSSDLSTELVM